MRCFRFVSVIAILCLGFPVEAEPTKPNIVFILADDVGCEVLGCYGGTSYKTPHLDELALNGMRFTHCYSMPVCHPSRIALLTGRYPFRTKRPRWGSFPKKEEPHTFAQVLKKAGYSSAVAGKWQLSLLSRDLEQPNRMGFDEYALFGWHEGPRYYDPLIIQNGKTRTDTKGKYGPDLYVDFLADFIERHKEGPFFAFYSMALAHDVTDDLKKPVPYGPRGRYDNYEEMANAMDRCVDRLVAVLDKHGLREKTLIVFTGDNGTARGSIIRHKDGKYLRDPVFSTIDGKKVRGGKGLLTDGGTRVPLIANWKGKIRPSQVIDDLVDFSDFLPTFADLASAALPKGVPLDGKSFAPRLLGKPGPKRPWAYSERGNKAWWVRTQRWKLYNDGRLLDMEHDPDERKPLNAKADSKESAKVREMLQGALDGLAE